MSTKLHNGYRIHRGVQHYPTAGPPRPALFAFIAQVRAALEPVTLACYAHKAATLATATIDRRSAAYLAVTQRNVAPALTRLSPAQTAAKIISDAARSIHETGYRNPDLDFAFEMVVMAHPHDANGPLYALLYTERAEYRNAFDELEPVESYAYWNSTDQPAELTESQWDHRRSDWDAVLADQPPARRGVTWQLTASGESPLSVAAPQVKQAIAAAMPSRAVRALALARETVPAMEVDPESVADGGAPWFIVRDLDVRDVEVAALAQQLEPELRHLTVEDLYAP